MRIPGIMNSQQLRKVMNSDRFGQVYFRGVFASDELKKQNVTQFPCGYIVNTDPSHKPGSHWAAFYFDKNKNGHFFCSYGKSPNEYKFDNWIDGNSKSWTYNEQRLQSDWSTVCGQYCLYYLLHAFRNISIRDNFTRDYDLNDIWVDKFIRKRFNIDTPMVDVEFLTLQVVRALREYIK